MPYTEQGSHVKNAARAYADLNVFGAVLALMESSLVSSRCHAAEAQIVKICQAEMQRCLRRFDSEVAKAGGGTPGG